MRPTPADVTRRIDHTLLTAEATVDSVDSLCDEAIAFGFGAVCVAGRFVKRVAERLDRALREGKIDGVGRAPLIVSVAGFPLGSSTTAVKADEARAAMDDGADEIDMVVALGALVDEDRDYVRKEIETLARVVHGHSPDGVLKVILETAALTEKQILLGCRCCAEGEADFVKTSTGFHPSGGATVDHVRLLHRLAAPIRVKASGGIRTAAAALAMLEAGAVRLGTSSGVAIIHELRQDP